MRRVYPKIENVKFLLCDSVREEVNKKLTILGLYGGDNIIFHPEKPKAFPYRLQSLSMIFILKNGSGDFDAKFKIIAPDGENVFDKKLKRMQITSGVPAVVGVQVANMEFNAEGNFSAVLRLEKKEYAFSFQVSSKSAEE